MRLYEFPECCTADVLTDLGESAIAKGGDHAVKKATIQKYILKKALVKHSHAMFTLITNNEQKTANKALLGLGFSHSKWMSKQQHPETKVRIWFMHIEELIKSNSKLYKKFKLV